MDDQEWERRITQIKREQSELLAKVAANRAKSDEIWRRPPTWRQGLAQFIRHIIERIAP